ncbi:DUF481 domain-containing protein [Aquimarina sp. U1-2]|uniref:DUF481 domain-containing protein n=1 Tax=Aquimarina sp. U1-2 TaxID=2823141 RepID=UPI001AEC964E|nr:DUF481 domain-containing protein [Aquimarina sp. U1-2]MBP2831852.1 DUF481 domain-containing protein [Aquimarina sp. U1-2]
MNNQTYKTAVSIISIVIMYYSMGIKNTFAQNTVKNDTIKWSYDISTSGFFSDDGATRLLVNNNGLLKTASSNFQNRLVLNYQFGKVGERWQENDFLAYNAFRLRPEKKTFPIAVGGIETSRTRDIDFRFFIGLGGGIEVIDKKTVFAEFTLAGWYERTNYGDTDFNRDEIDGSSIRSVWRMSPRVRGDVKLNENQLIFEFEGWIQPTIDDFEDYRSFVNSSFLIQMVKKLYFKIGWLATYESYVLQGRNQWDSIITLGITYKKN